MIYGGVSSGIMLFGISLIYGMTGTTNLYNINAIIQLQSFPYITFLIAGLFILVGMGFKISAAGNAVYAETGGLAFQPPGRDGAAGRN